MTFKSVLQYTVLAAITCFGAINLSGCQVMRGETSVSQYTDDSVITTRVKAKLVQSDQVSATRVSVETNRGVVLLSGFVRDQHQAMVATSIARSVRGVRAVKNRLVVN